MRHRRKKQELGRSTGHRKALVASLVGNLIDHKRILTTLTKAKVAQRAAEKLVTIARTGTLTARRSVLSVLRQEKHVTQLFNEIVAQFDGRHGATPGSSRSAPVQATARKWRFWSGWESSHVNAGKRRRQRRRTSSPDYLDNSLAYSALWS